MHLDLEGNVFHGVPDSRYIQNFMNNAVSQLRNSSRTTLKAYMLEQIWLCTNLYREQNGDWPWPADDWQEFLLACEKQGRKIRPVEGKQDLGKIQ